MAAGRTSRVTQAVVPDTTHTRLPRTLVRDLALLSLAALLLYPLLWPHAPLHTGDSPQYLAVARDLSDLHLSELHDRSIGYPLVLALADRLPTPPRALLILSLLLHIASVWMLAVLLRLAGAGRRLLLGFSAVLLLPPFVEPAGHVMTENLAQFMLAAGLCALALWTRAPRAWLLALSGAAFAYAALTRPTYQALTPVLAACLVGVSLARRDGPNARRAALAGAVLAAFTALAVGIVSWGNHRAFGYFGLVPMTGYHLSTKTMNIWERLPEEHAEVREILIRARDVERTRRGGTYTGSQTIWQVRDELLAATGMTKAELSSHLVRLNLLLIRRAPIEYLQEVARSLATCWFPPAGELADMGLTPLRWTWALVHAGILGLFFLQLVVFSGVSVFGWTQRVARTGSGGAYRLAVTTPQLIVYVLAAVIVFYTMVLSTALDIGEARQRRPTDVLIVLMVFTGIQMWGAALRPALSRQD